ncbi:uncharacterized protein LOC126574108 isoform X2 [Anopheles aquasalis]|uniref:uncharacterized protein LOC126574108 isoform X2 n=1 Tax=Anopheles aquasalis TaxID=42839 RepID=UPI00215A4E13|nr:uncharacterized protein LOC126574108 isoform X2 [Anopheles aquasalis]
MERTGQYGRVSAYCPYSDSSSSLQSYVRPFDTVRALHETVVSLRTALEESRREVDQLRQQITVRDTVEQARQSHGKPLDIPLGSSEQPPPDSGRSLRFQLNPDPAPTVPSSHSVPNRETLEEPPSDRKCKRLKKRKTKSQQPPEEEEESGSSPQPPVQEPEQGVPTKKSSTTKDASTSHQTVSVVPDIQIVSHPGTGTSSAMASRIDVKIKVSSNITMDDSSSEPDSSEANAKDAPDQPQEEPQQQPQEEDEESVDRTPEDDDEKTIAERVPDPGEDEITVREEINRRKNEEQQQQLGIRKSSEAISIRQVSSENLQVDTDRQSNASISEGDNSVFAEDPVTDGEGHRPVTGSYTVSDLSEHRQRVKKSDSENQEEVDDIELIFSSDDNAKDITQEDLVSISDYEPWHETGQSGTPVLVSFANLGSDPDKTSSLDRSDSEAAEDGMYEMGLAKGKSLESQDSLSMDNIKKSLDCSTKSSSLEKGSSVDLPVTAGVGAVVRQGSEGRRDDSFDAVGPSSSLMAAGAMGRRWTNYNVLIETDISKCGITTEENILEMGRRNTCPNPPAYRPIIHPSSRMPASAAATTTTTTNRSPLAVKFSRSPRTYSPHQYLPPGKTLRTVIAADSGVKGVSGDEVKRSRAAQTDISALAQQWRSETHLAGSEYVPGLYTLPSKFVPPAPGGKGKFPLRIPPSFSMTSPGVSQWTVNESSIATQTTQTDAFWTSNRGDSFDSSKSYSASSRYSTLSKHHRSRSVPSMRCAVCRQNHQNTALRPSESMHYTPRVTFQDQPMHKIRGSLPDLRHDCNCPRRYGGPSLYRIHGDSGGSTDSLLEEAEEFLRRSLEGGNMLLMEDSLDGGTSGAGGNAQPAPAVGTPGSMVHNVLHGHAAGHGPHLHHPTPKHRRCSENDIQRDFIPSKHALPFLPKTAKCLKPGHLAKVISRSGRIVVGRVRYIGPLATAGTNADADESYVGLQLPNNLGECDGTIDGKHFFDCEPLHGIFVPFKKVVMAWNS